MMRMIYIWSILSILIFAGIYTWRNLTGKEKWHLTKIAAYATICSLLSVLILSFIVVLF
jgi:hypothetical protein